MGGGTSGGRGNMGGGTIPCVPPHAVGSGPVCRCTRKECVRQHAGNRAGISLKPPRPVCGCTREHRFLAKIGRKIRPAVLGWGECVPLHAECCSWGSCIPPQTG